MTRKSTASIWPPGHAIDRVVYRVVASAIGIDDTPAAVLRLLHDYFIALYSSKPARVFKAIPVKPRTPGYRAGDVVLAWEVRTRLVDGIPVARVRTGTNVETSLSIARWISLWSETDDVEGLHAVATDQAGAISALRYSPPGQGRNLKLHEMTPMKLHQCAVLCAQRNGSSVSEREVVTAAAQP